MHFLQFLLVLVQCLIILPEPHLKLLADVKKLLVYRRVQLLGPTIDLLRELLHLRLDPLAYIGTQKVEQVLLSLGCADRSAMILVRELGQAGTALLSLRHFYFYFLLIIHLN